MPPEHLVLKSCVQSYWLKFSRILVEYREIVAHFYYYITGIAPGISSCYKFLIKRLIVFLHVMSMGNRV